jgi:two-component system OmpR family response regulator
LKVAADSSPNTGSSNAEAKAAAGARVRLLLIEDDLEAAEYLIKGLQENGYVVEHAADGHDGMHRAISSRYDAIIADRQLPHVDGLTIIGALRERGDRTPVLILSALGTVDERVHGLNAGGDDYLTKPFALVELLARIDALRRRSTDASEVTRLKVADLELDLLARRVTRGGRPIELTAKEFQLLEYLMRRPGQVVTRTMLLEGVWNLHFDPQTNIIDVHMSRLRTSVDKGFSRPLIHTVRGAGYVLKDEQ